MIYVAGRTPARSLAAEGEGSTGDTLGVDMLFHEYKAYIADGLPCAPSWGIRLTLAVTSNHAGAGYL